jgi:hypothetical protein
MDETKFQILARASVLGCPIDAGYIRNGTENIFVVYGKAQPEQEAMSLGTLVTRLYELVSFGEQKEEDVTKELTSQLPENIAAVIDDIRFKLKEVFFVTSSAPKTDNDKELIKKKTGEFAFWFEIELDDLTANWPILQIENVSIKIWRTKNPQILDEMKISEMEKLLVFAKNTVKELPPA